MTRYYQSPESGIVVREESLSADIRAKLTPVVVIDPKDPEQAERLVWALYAAGVRGLRVEDIQAALRSLIEPPKPEEPTGLGAVVEDAEGQQWVRVDPEDPLAVCWRNSRGGAWQDYEGIAAVKVLSEGVR